MNPETRKVRQYLKDCPRSDYDRLTYESKLTEMQEDALKLCIVEGKSLDEAADVLSCSARSVSKFLNQAFAKIARIKE